MSPFPVSGSVRSADPDADDVLPTVPRATTVKYTRESAQISTGRSGVRRFSRWIPVPGGRGGRFYSGPHSSTQKATPPCRPSSDMASVASCVRAGGPWTGPVGPHRTTAPQYCSGTAGRSGGVSSVRGKMRFLLLGVGMCPQSEDHPESDLW